MPEATPLSKIRGTGDFDVEVILYGGGYDAAYGKTMEPPPTMNKSGLTGREINGIHTEVPGAGRCSGNHCIVT